MNNILKYILTAVVAFAVGIGGVYLVRTLSAGKSPEPVTEKPGRTTVTDKPVTLTELPAKEQDTDTVGETGSGTGQQQPSAEDVPAVRDVPQTSSGTDRTTVTESAPAIAVDKSAVVVREESASTFSVTGLRALNASAAGARFVLSDSEKHYYKSDANGEFHGVAANSKGVYAVAAYDNATGSKSAVVTISGFKSKTEAQTVKQQTAASVEPLTAGELASIFNTGNSDNLRPVSDRFASRNCHVSSNVAGVSTLSDVFRCVNMEGLSASVTSLKYDAAGRITAVSVNLQ